MTLTKSLTRSSSAGDDLVGVIRKLSTEVAAGDIRLPSLPDIAVRVQKVLEDPRAARSRVAQVIGADAALAARILRLANSAFLNPSTLQITDLQQALTRLGQQLVRCSAVSFSLQQLELGSGETELRSQVRELWRQGALVASIAYVLARETGAAKADEALMTGLMHNIGRLYIAVNEPRRDENSAWEQVVGEWHPQIARSILKHWKFPATLIAAVAGQNMSDSETGADDGLTDVLTVSIALASCVFQRELLDDAVTAALPFRRLGLDSAACQRLLAAASDQIKALRAALSS